MKKSNTVKAVLIVSGLIASIIGGAILIVPTLFYASYGIELGANINLLNEIRASGGGLLVTGLLILSGAFIAQLTFTSMVVSTMLYLGFGLSRLFSTVIDGIPNEGLVQSAVLEIIIGLICLFILVIFQQRQRREV